MPANHCTELRFREARSGETEDILELIRLSLGTGRIPRDEEYWNWKHRENPFGPSPCFLAVSGEKIVGLRVFLRWNWQGGGTTWPAVRAVDTATHPEWRGRGIFTRLTLDLVERMKSDGVGFVFNTPNQKSRPGYLKMGWSDLGRISLLVRPLRPVSLAWKVVTRVRGDEPSEGTPSALDKRPGMGMSMSELLDERDLPAFLERQAESRRRLATCRSVSYLRWRYLTIPGFRYGAIWNLTGDRGAVLIFRVNRAVRWTELRLSEVLVTPGSETILRELLGSLTSEVNAHFMSAMAAGRTTTRSTLIRSGFLPVPRIGPRMTVRPLNAISRQIDPLKRQAWNLAVGDLELF